MNSPILRGALPPGDRIKGPTRVVEIDGVDINACGGTHLRSLAELQVCSSFRAQPCLIDWFLANGVPW